MNQHPIIKVKNFSAHYEKKVILEKINFEVMAGEIFMIVGGSGCGKTTLFNHMIGLLEPASGEIHIDGDNLFKVSEKKQLAILKKIGVLYQQGALFGSMNLLENVCLPLEELTLLPKEAIEIIAQNKLRMVGLGDFCDYMPAEISGGMQKRVAIARAMALDPKILFLDEPSAGLDPIMSAELDQLIDNLSKTLGITFVIITHDLASIFKIGERAILLYDGHIVAEGTPKTLQKSADPLVKKFFKGHTYGNSQHRN